VGVTTAVAEGQGDHREPGRHRRPKSHRLLVGVAAGVVAAACLTVVLVVVFARPDPGWPHAFCGPVINLLTKQSPDAAYQAAMSGLPFPQARRLLADQQAFEMASADAANRDNLQAGNAKAVALKAGEKVSRDLRGIAWPCRYAGKLDNAPHAAW
jgi:hypothetical protein